MPSIKKIQESLNTLTVFESEYSLRIKSDPEDLSLKLTYQNIRSQINELQQQLYFENINREKEIIELRLIGDKAKFGSFPLKLVGGLTNSFSKAILNSSKYFQYGNKGGAKIEKIISDSIDLRLERLGSGSTIFFLSARTSPDLFGNSIIQNSLENIFELFNSQTGDQVIENISNVGAKSIKYFSSFLKESLNDDLEIDLSWHTPQESTLKWEGTKDKISSLFATLNNIKLSEPEEIYFEGEIITLSLKGKFEIFTKEKERLYGNFPNELVDKMKQLHIGDYCKGSIQKMSIISPSSEKEKIEYSLKEIAIY